VPGCNIAETLALVIDGLRLPRGAVSADLGCGDGQRGARALAERGLVVFGCEMDPDKAARAGAFAEIDVCDVRHWRPPEPLDLIVCAELLEHLPRDDQAQLLRDMRGWLRVGGHVVLSTPQRNSPVALVERAHTRARGTGPYDWWDPTHVGVRRRRQLERLFRASGFVIERRVGLHFVPQLSGLSALQWTRHEGRLGTLGFDLIYVLG
jgi:2-polyprenyl-3-methyl-5-hydroxy-6-metoxy-1,4-benzoquinol methylase